VAQFYIDPGPNRNQHRQLVAGMQVSGWKSIRDKKPANLKPANLQT
jgi:hypothetical protein